MASPAIIYLPLIPLIAPIGFDYSNYDQITVTRSPRLRGLPSISRILLVNEVLSALALASFFGVFSLLIALAAPANAIYFVVAAIVCLYVAVLFITRADTVAADALVSTIRAALDRPDETYLEADLKKILHAANARKFAIRDSVITTHVELEKDRTKGRTDPSKLQTRSALSSIGRYAALAILIVLPILALYYSSLHFKEYGDLFASLGTPAKSPIEVFYRLFIAHPWATCGEKDTACAGALSNLQHWSGNPLLTFVRFAYVALLTYLPTRYLLSLYEYRLLLRWTKGASLGLEIDVVKRIGAIAAGTIAIITGMIFVDVPFGQIGVFSGLIAAGLSIALRDTLGNLMGGAILIWDGTIKKGDVITIPRSESSDTGSTYGIVREMRMRYTIVEDRNTVRRLIPNSLLVTDPIESWTHEDRKVRLSLKIGVAYGTDLREAKQIMEAVCYDVPRVLSDKAPQALVTGFGDSSIDFSLRFWLRDTSDGIRPVISEILINLFERFDEAKIVIPFPQRDIHLDFDPAAKPVPEEISRQQSDYSLREAGHFRWPGQNWSKAKRRDSK